MERDRNRDVTVAWLTAAFERQKKLPELHSLLTIRSTRERPTIEQQRSMLTMLSERYGFPMRKTRLIKVVH